MKVTFPAAETIAKCHSIRTYKETPLSTQDREALETYRKELDNPFGVPVYTHIIDKELRADREKLGTYGVIKGA